MKRLTLRERLLSKAVIDFETGCWEWTAYKSADGYGQIRVDGRSLKAHRVAYELIEGPIPEGLVIDHLCRNRACINPAHMEPVTMGENTLRSPVQFAAINARRTHCPAEHEYTPENTRVSGGRRYCRICAKAFSDRYVAANRGLVRAQGAASARRRSAAKALAATLDQAVTA